MEGGVVFEVDGISINYLWYADDSIVVSNTVEGARRNLEVVREIGYISGWR